LYRPTIRGSVNPHTPFCHGNVKSVERLIPERRNREVEIDGEGSLRTEIVAKPAAEKAPGQLG